MDILDAHPDVWAPIQASTLLATKNKGRPRQPGEWGLMWLHFVNSAEQELLRWYRGASPEMWARCGFAKVPSYHGCYDTFGLMEPHSLAFEEVAHALIAIARKASDGLVGRDVHVDGTEAETNSRLLHDCQGDELETCKRQHRLPQRAAPSEAHAQRHAVSEVEPDDDALNSADDEYPTLRGRRLKLKGCWYLLGDDEAGVRAYTKSGKVTKFWAG